MIVRGAMVPINKGDPSAVGHHGGVAADSGEARDDLAVTLTWRYDVTGKKNIDISGEEWREYSIPGRTAYRINNPQRLWIGDTHDRVLDGDGIVHCVPMTGGAVLRWKPKDEKNPVWV